MEHQAEVTYRAKLARTANRLDSNTPTIDQQYIAPIAHLVKHNKIGFGHPAG